VGFAVVLERLTLAEERRSSLLLTPRTEGSQDSADDSTTMRFAPARCADLGTRCTVRSCASSRSRASGD
jgi:hypothetical protein